jgi:hypothetical protein
MTLPEALRKAFVILREEDRAVLLTMPRCKYRLAPNDRPPRGYLIWRSVHYNDAWQPWSVVENFDVDDILTDKWSIQ